MDLLMLLPALSVMKKWRNFTQIAWDSQAIKPPNQLFAYMPTASQPAQKIR
jgi:hypothetical protein